MSGKKLKSLAAIACAFTCAFGFAACAPDDGEKDEGTKKPSTQQPNYDPPQFDSGSLLVYQLNEDENGYSVIGLNTTEEANISIPDTYDGLPVVAIANDAFSGCDNLTGIAIGKNVEYIGENAFILCSGLSTIKIPANIKQLGEGAFNNCSSLRLITFEEGIQISEIGQSTFQNCTALTTITIPDSVTTIGPRAFQACTALRTVIFGDGVTRIKAEVFRGCTALTNVTFGSNVSIIEKCVFQRCTALENLVIPESVTYIGENLLFGCTSMTSITIPFVGSGIPPKDETPDEEVGDGDNEENKPATTTYKYSTEFAHIFGSVPATLKYVTVLGGGEIGTQAFLYCNNIQRIKLGKGVTTLGLSCFYVCYGLTELILAGNLDRVLQGATYASSLETIYFEGTQEEWKKPVIYENNDPFKLAKIYFYSEEYPFNDEVTSGRFWHYVDNEPVIWEV